MVAWNNTKPTEPTEESLNRETNTVGGMTIMLFLSILLTWLILMDTVSLRNIFIHDSCTSACEQRGETSENFPDGEFDGETLTCHCPAGSSLRMDVSQMWRE